MAPARCLIQSLLVTCPQQEVDACTYLIDVLQRISVHPALRRNHVQPGGFVEMTSGSLCAIAGANDASVTSEGTVSMWTIDANAAPGRDEWL